MSTTLIPGAADDDVSRFPSLAALRAAHGELLRRHDETHETPAFLSEVEAFIRQGRATGTLLDGHNDRWAAQGILNYWATILYRVGREPPEGSLAEFDLLLEPDLPDSLCPYLGLDAFDEGRRGYFFGRRRLVDEWVSRLANGRLLAIVGPSGSGRSSVVLGGLVPALKDGGVPGSGGWRYYPPMVPGSDPLASLARLLQSPDGDADDWVDRQVEAFLGDADHLTRLIGEHGDGPALLIVEQFEELFTLCADERARRAFVDNLVGLIQAPGARHIVILTMLSDAERLVERLQTFHQHFEQAEVRLTPPSAGELREAIEQPAKLVGLRFEDGIVDELVQDICGEVAELPLLQFSLLKLWEQRDRNRVTWDAYRRVGGGRIALARSADAFFQGLDAEDRDTAKRVVLRMFRPAEGLEVASNRVQRELLYAEGEARDRVDRVLAGLIQARLVRQTGGKSPADVQVELAHEALMRSWPTLAGWLDDQRVAIITRRKLEVRAGEWVQRGRGHGGLLDEGQVFEAERWLATPEAEYVGYDEIVPAFVHASRRAVREEEARRRSAERTRRIGIGIALASILVAIVTWSLYRATVADYRAAVAESDKMLMEQKAEAAATAHALETEKAAESRRQADLARSRQLAQEAVAGALRRSDDRLDLGLLMALEAGRLAEVGEDPGNLLVRGTLLNGLVSRSNLSTFLYGHTASIGSLALSPDGMSLATGDVSGIIVVHDVPSGQAIARPLLGRQNSEIRSLAFSPDSTTLASAGSDGTLLLWEVASGTQIGPPLTGHSGSVQSVVFSPDGKMLVSGGSDKTIRLWDIVSGTLQDPLLTGHTGAVQSLAFSRDGTLLASAGSDGTLILWDFASRKRRGDPLTGHTLSVQSVAFSRDGTLLASGSADSTIRLWDVATGSPRGEPLQGHTAAVQSVAFSPDGKTVASGSADKTIRLWDVASHRTRDVPFVGYTERVQRVAFNREGTRLISAHADGALILWNISTTAPPTVGHLFSFSPRVLSSVAVGPDGKTFTNGSVDGTLTLTNIGFNPRVSEETGRLFNQRLPGHSANVQSVAFSPDGKTLASGSCAVNVDDETLCDHGEIRLWQTDSGQPLGPPLTGHDGTVLSLAFSPDGKTLASGGSDTAIILWDVDGRHPDGAPLTGQTAAVQSLVFSPDHKTLASGGLDGAIVLWDVRTGSTLGVPLTGHTSSVQSLAFSPDGLTLASGSRDTTVILWDVVDRQPRGRPLADHTSGVLSMAFSPDGTMLASGSDDRTVILRDVATRQPLSRPLADHASAVVGLGFSPDGRTLMSVSKDRSIVWDMRYDDWKARACEIVARNWTSEEWPQYLSRKPDPFMCPQGLLRQANAHALAGNATQAEADFTKAVELATRSDDARFNNSICWLGAINRFERAVLPACERAVELATATSAANLVMYRDSRGLARALLGDTPGAIDDFTAFAQWSKGTASYDDLGRNREAWIVRLQAGDNPFDPPTLRALRQE